MQDDQTDDRDEEFEEFEDDPESEDLDERDGISFPIDITDGEWGPENWGLITVGVFFAILLYLWWTN